MFLLTFWKSYNVFEKSPHVFEKALSRKCTKGNVFVNFLKKLQCVKNSRNVFKKHFPEVHKG